MDLELAHKIEAAESEYLRSRVESLTAVSGNPYGARVFLNGDFPCFEVKASPSPMFNRIYGDITNDPHAVLKWLKRSTTHSAVTPLIGKPSALEQYALVGEARLERLRGWTHLQFAYAIEKSVLSRASFDIEEVTPSTLAVFAGLHASGFRTKPEHRLLNQASFAGQSPGGRLNIYLLKAQGEAVAGASMYLASNGIAYLGTAATRKDARGRGYHGALIAHRIAQAKKLGCRWVAATALANSQSRRNLERAGLTASHAQALYRLADD
ncbi:GNAT family N-acetyltransferase [Pseudomonas sp. BCA14]|uniref:GNAT family N-acetyltransferase n=1 Tax=unclassified Pseudomonas TaxID=196821 RepID=UPI00106EA704|nr:MULTISPECIES: GNAT family N-acetyltransferase [unclassified Pseudomonas]TFF02533.1 GNAT family N-acetyltransferase [Pseudomonas sp. JMN1]TFF03733.1 GNAT family N-acetyltransferase [Pseudomonas sp. BCA17]TFF18126.1 GNAT family N-acetyltransferase [Pseudomonas sp. BCA14]TFF18842.1 GNAT family N-acetyltransferase [Pseudomonas sp. BCA13]